MNRFAASILVVATLGVATSRAMTGDSVDEKFRGEWVPGKAACTSPLKLVIDATVVTFVNGAQRERFPKLEQCFSCMAHDDTSGTVVLMTDKMGDGPFSIYLNPSGKQPVVTATYNDKRLTSRFPLGDVALKKCAAQDSTAPAVLNVSGTYTYLGSGIAKVEQHGSDVRILMTWTPAGAGPHYEVRAKITGNAIEGKWYSHYARKGWFYFNGEVSPSGKMIDLSKSDDPIRSNFNRSKLLR